MPKMVLKQESRLNGVKTNIFNLDEVAKALRVPEEGKLTNNYSGFIHVPLYYEEHVSNLATPSLMTSLNDSKLDSNFYYVV